MERSPKMTQTFKEIDRDYHKSVAMPNSVSKTFESARTNKELPKELIGEMRSHVGQRWPKTNWD